MTAPARHPNTATAPAAWRQEIQTWDQDWLDAFNERAGFLEFDCREPRPVAERRAFDEIKQQMENSR